MTQEKFLWNYFTFAGTPFHLQLTAREKNWTRGGKLSKSKLYLKTDLKKRGILDLKGFLSPSIQDLMKFINFSDSQFNS